MKNPWEVFAELYFDALRTKSHEMAVVVPVAAMLHDATARREGDIGHGLAHMKLAADEWHSAGSGDRQRLREALRHAWTDWALEATKRSSR